MTRDWNITEEVTSNDVFASPAKASWITIQQWGAAQEGEFRWARLCRFCVNTLLVSLTALLLFLVKPTDNRATTPEARLQILVVCIALLIVSLLPPLLQRGYRRWQGKEIITDEVGGASWL